MPFGLSSLAVKAAFVALVGIAAFTGGVRLEHRLADSRYVKLELQYAEAQAKAVAEAQAEQHRQDGISTAAAEREAAQQASLADTARRQLIEVRKHVPKDRVCVRVGFIRVLVAASRGVLADSLPLAAGQSDNACAGYSNADVATAVVDSLAKARANGEQLDALIRFYHDSKK